MPVLVIVSRYLHVIAAILVVGGTFFMRVVLPLGLAQADAASRDAVFLRCRRVFKMVVHSCTLLFLLTGAFNSYVAWNDYKLNRPLMHGLWGPHLLLGLTALTIAFVSLGPKQPPPRHRMMGTLTLVLLFAAILCASTLKYVRDHAVKNPPAAVTAR